MKKVISLFMILTLILSTTTAFASVPIKAVTMKKESEAYGIYYNKTTGNYFEYKKGDFKLWIPNYFNADPDFDLNSKDGDKFMLKSGKVSMDSGYFLFDLIKKSDKSLELKARKMNTDWYSYGHFVKTTKAAALKHIEAMKAKNAKLDLKGLSYMMYYDDVHARVHEITANQINIYQRASGESEFKLNTETAYTGPVKLVLGGYVYHPTVKARDQEGNDLVYYILEKGKVPVSMVYTNTASYLGYTFVPIKKVKDPSEALALSKTTQAMIDGERKELEDQKIAQEKRIADEKKTYSEAGYLFTPYDPFVGTYKGPDYEVISDGVHVVISEVGGDSVTFVVEYGSVEYRGSLYSTEEPLFHIYLNSFNGTDNDRYLSFDGKGTITEIYTKAYSVVSEKMEKIVLNKAPLIAQ